MEWTRRKIVILYGAFLVVVFLLSGLLTTPETIKQYKIKCDDGEVQTFNLSDKYICGGHKNPLIKDDFVINLSSSLHKFK